MDSTEPPARPGRAAHPKSTLVLPTRPGLLIGGRYELIQRLGAGSMGEVWVARHRTLDERVAVKLLARSSEHAEFENAATAAARFRFEAQVAARLSRRTRHIVQVTDHGEEGALAFLVMELLEGRTLDALVARRGCLSPRDAAELVRQIARGLAHAHAEGVVHRDLKPANVFVTRDEDETLLFKLLDFGIARLMRRTIRSIRPSAHTTGANVVLGTAGYMSPEQIEGETPPDRHVDLWALATVAYEAMTGELPLPGFSSDELIENLRARQLVPVHERNAALPVGLAPFFERAFAERLDLRFESAAELASAFACAVESSGSDLVERGPVSPYATTERAPASTAPLVSKATQAPARRGLAVSIAVLTALLVVAVAMVGSPWRARTSVRTLSATTTQAPRTSDTSPSVEALAPLPLEANEPLEPLPPRPPRAPAAALQPSGCVPPFELGKDGSKHWKRDCL